MGNASRYAYKGTPWYYSRTNEISVTFEDGITSIGAQTFLDCTGLKMINYNNESYDSLSSFKEDFEQNERTIGNKAFHNTGLLT